MIAGIIDALRAKGHPLSVRLVWQCIENHADRARCWNATDAAIASEIGVSVDTVSRAVAILQREDILDCVRHKRRRTTFRMLRTYPEGCPRPRHEPEVAGRLHAELSPQKSEPSPELSPQNPETFNPPVSIHQREEEERAHAREAPPSVVINAREQGVPAGRVPLPSELVLTQIVEDEIKAAGHDPQDVVQLAREWCEEQEAETGKPPTSANWPRVVVQFARRTPPKRRQLQQHAAKPVKQDRMLQVAAGWRALWQQRAEARP